LAEPVKPRAGPAEFDSHFAWLVPTWRSPSRLGLGNLHLHSSCLPDEEVSAVARASKLLGYGRSLMISPEFSGTIC
jgi:hypothetical protein